MDASSPAAQDEAAQHPAGPTAEELAAAAERQRQQEAAARAQEQLMVGRPLPNGFLQESILGLESYHSFTAAPLPALPVSHRHTEPHFLHNLQACPHHVPRRTSTMSITTCTAVALHRPHQDCQRAASIALGRLRQREADLADYSAAMEEARGAAARGSHADGSHTHQHSANGNGNGNGNGSGVHAPAPLLSWDEQGRVALVAAAVAAGGGEAAGSAVIAVCDRCRWVTMLCMMCGLGGAWPRAV